jgi:hypothetical protein
MRSTALAAIALLPGLIGLAVAGCGGPGAFVREGDANSVEIGFSGDIGNAMPVARRHCAQYEREARLVGPTLDGALFDCVRPGAGQAGP